VYITYCSCSSNTVSKVRFTGENEIINPWGSVDPSSRPSPVKLLKLIHSLRTNAAATTFNLY